MLVCGCPASQGGILLARGRPFCASGLVYGRKITMYISLLCIHVHLFLLCVSDACWDSPTEPQLFLQSGFKVALSAPVPVETVRQRDCYIPYVGELSDEST